MSASKDGLGMKEALLLAMVNENRERDAARETAREDAVAKVRTLATDTAEERAAACRAVDVKRAARVLIHVVDPARPADLSVMHRSLAFVYERLARSTATPPSLREMYTRHAEELRAEEPS